MEKKKRPIRERNTQLASVRMPLELIDAVDAYAERMGVPRATVINTAVYQYLAPYITAGKDKE